MVSLSHLEKSIFRISAIFLLSEDAAYKMVIADQQYFGNPTIKCKPGVDLLVDDERTRAATTNIKTGILFYKVYLRFADVRWRVFCH